MKNFQCKHIPNKPILEFLLKFKGTWCNWFEGYEHSVRNAFPEIPSEKLILKKMEQLIKRELVTGCVCGCRGDFEITPKGEQYLENEKIKSYDNK